MTRAEPKFKPQDIFPSQRRPPLLADDTPAAKVLVAEYSASTRERLRRFLSRHYEVFTAASAEQAISVAAEQHPDLIVADMTMLGRDPGVLLEPLRTDPATAAIPVILMSRRASRQARLEAIQAGAQDCLQKPVNARELQARVRRALNFTRQYREALRREQRLSAATVGILESMKQGFMLVDSDWRILYVNAEGERLSGIPRKDLLGRNHWEVFPAALGTIVERKYRHAMATRTAVKYEHYYAPFGRWFENGASPVGDGALLLFASDITDRKHMEEALRATDARLTAELEAMNRLHDLSTRLLALPDLGAALEEILDASIAMLDAAMGCIELYNSRTGTLEMVAHRGFREDLLGDLRTAHAGDTSASARVMKSGQRVIIEDVKADQAYLSRRQFAVTAGYAAVQATPFVSRRGQLLGVLSTHFRRPHRPSERDLRMLDLYANQATDLIERIRAEEALRESEKRAALVLSSMTDGFEVLDDRGRFIYFNPAARRMLAEQGIDADDLIGRQYLTEVFPEARDDESGRGYRRAMAERIPVAVENFFVPFNRWYSIRYFPMDTGAVSVVIEDITERKRAEQALRESEAKFRALAEASPALIAQLDANGNVIYVNRRHLDLFGDNALTLLETGWHSVLHPDDAATFMTALEQALRNRARFHRRVRVSSKQNEWRWLDAYGAPWFSSDGQYAGHVCISIDITDAVQLEFTQRTYRMATEGGNEGFYIIRPIRGMHAAIVDFEIVDSNHRGAEFLGRRPNDLIGKKVSSLCAGDELRRLLEMLSGAMETGFYEADIEVPSGGPVWLRWIHCKIVRSYGELAVTVRDISDAKAHVDELERRGNEDALTGLRNRYWLHTYLPQAIARASSSHAQLAVLFLDLDGFKAVNDVLGHSAGDELLRVAGRRLKVAVRPQDKVARLGGDEFVIVLENIDDKLDAAHVAERVLHAFQENFTLSQGVVHSVGTSIGVSLFPSDGKDADTLLRNADNAMYAVKTNGKQDYRFFDPVFYDALRARLEKEAELRHAVERDEFVMYYQPRIDMTTGTACSMEALVRWIHPTKGLLEPLEFIPLAEETGLILRLGELVIEKVCAQLEYWMRTEQAPTPVSINVSPRQFNETDVAHTLAAALARHHVDPDLIEVELTESSMMDNWDAAGTLDTIRRTGCKLLVDDFGAGYSSLSQLQRLDFDVLKVDRAFTVEIGGTEKGKVFFEAIITMAHALGMRVVAEGVENEQQASILKSLRCDEVQGYYISQALPADAVPSALPGWRLPSTPRPHVAVSQSTAP